MGGNSSKGPTTRRYVPSYDEPAAGSSSSWDNFGGGYPPQSPLYPQQTPHHQLASSASAPFYDYSQPKRKLDRRYSRIADNYRSLDEVIRTLHVTVFCDFLV